MKKFLLGFLLISFFSFVMYGQSTKLEVPIKSTGGSVTDTLDDGTIVTLDLSTDDAEQENDEMDALYDDDLDAGWEGAPEDQNILTTGLRFRDIAIPQGATIDSAFVVMYAHEGKDAEGVCNLTITGDASDDAETFNDSTLITDRTMTTAAVNWVVAEEWIIWKPYSTPDLGVIIQEIVNRPGWTAGNSLALILAGEDQGPSDLENAREWMAFENIQDPSDVDPDGVPGDGKNHPDKVPKLTVYYSTAGTSVRNTYGLETIFNVYPNPADGIINISVMSDDVSRIQIFNAMGQLVRSNEVRSKSITMDVSDLKSGLYIFRAVQENRISTQKVILR
jgi:hypothetical protein